MAKPRQQVGSEHQDQDPADTAVALSVWIPGASARLLFRCRLHLERSLVLAREELEWGVKVLKCARERKVENNGSSGYGKVTTYICALTHTFPPNLSPARIAWPVALFFLEDNPVESG